MTTAAATRLPIVVEIMCSGQQHRHRTKIDKVIAFEELMAGS